MKYRKKPIVIEAIKWTGFNYDEASLFTGRRYTGTGDDRPHKLAIFTLEGVMQADPGDYIIKGIKGEVYPCKPEIFEASYDRVD